MVFEGGEASALRAFWYSNLSTEYGVRSTYLATSLIANRIELPHVARWVRSPFLAPRVLVGG